MVDAPPKHARHRGGRPFLHFAKMKNIALERRQPGEAVVEGARHGRGVQGHVLHMSGMPAPVDREGIKALPNVFGDAFNLTHAVDEMVAEGDTVAARWTVHGIHEGEFQGIAPTKNRVELSGLTIHHLADGKIREGWVIFDSISLLQQLGAVPGAAQTAA